MWSKDVIYNKQSLKPARFWGDNGLCLWDKEPSQTEMHKMEVERRKSNGESRWDIDMFASIVQVIMVIFLSVIKWKECNKVRRKNYIALIFALIFTVCHIAFGIINFIVWNAKPE